MPFLFKDYIYPMAWHGGVKNLDLMDKLTLELTIWFPFTANENGSMNLTNVTMNLMSDFEIDLNNQVYAVKWGDNTPDQDTVSQADNPDKHVHVYIGGTNQSSREKTYIVECYGYNFTKYYPIEYIIGNFDAGTGYKYRVREVSHRARRKYIQD